MTLPTVLVDLTAYQTPHRKRGIGRYVRDLARGLADVSQARSGSLRVVGLAWIDERGRPTLLEDIGRLAPIVSDAELARAAKSVRWRRRLHLGAAARRVGARLVHLPDARGTPFDSTPRIATCHDLIPLRFPARYLNWKDGWSLVRRLRDRRRYGCAEHVIAISHETRRDLISLLGIRESAVSVVYNGIDLALWTADARPDDAATLARFGLSKDGYLLHVGAADWRKNVEGALSGLALASDRLGRGLTFALAGEPTPGELAEATRAAARHGMTNRLKLLGRIDDASLGALYRGALAHVLVSFAEGFGLTLIEAMACGTPVIATRGSSLAEVAGDAAMLVDPASPAAIADAIVEIFGRTEVRCALARRGLARAATFSRQRFAEETLSAYERVLANPRLHKKAFDRR